MHDTAPSFSEIVTQKEEIYFLGFKTNTLLLNSISV